MNLKDKFQEQFSVWCTFTILNEFDAKRNSQGFYKQILKNTKVSWHLGVTFYFASLF